MRRNLMDAAIAGRLPLRHVGFSVLIALSVLTASSSASTDKVFNGTVTNGNDHGHIQFVEFAHKINLNHIAASFEPGACPQQLYGRQMPVNHGNVNYHLSFKGYNVSVTGRVTRHKFTGTAVGSFSPNPVIKVKPCTPATWTFVTHR